MARPLLTLTATVLFCSSLSAQQIQRQLGDFDLKLSTNSPRSMAQGLISPSAVGALHGGVDIRHSNGWYFGQYAPSFGLSPNSTLKLDSYLGYRGRLDDSLGFEAGLIHYSKPNLADSDSYALYGGISVSDTHFGWALRDNPGNLIGTFLADFGQLPLLEVDLTLKVAHHRLSTPFTIGDGSQVGSFSDWYLELSRPWLGIDLNLIYSSSDLQGAGCDLYAGINSYCERLVIFKAQRSFF
ncbi:TorF family putative porin [Pseudomonas alkylphenolica]|uniref:TorF family putative porin n=1 Tax=Pseudomonas alkylphenolica TaxID=237609 RepID=UPI000FBE7B05